MVPTELILTDSDEQAIAEGCYYDKKAAQRVIDFIERFCCLSKGRWGGKPIKLLDWQLSLIRRAFGWKRPDGTRRTREVYCEIPKKTQNPDCCPPLS